MIPCNFCEYIYVSDILICILLNSVGININYISDSRGHIYWVVCPNLSLTIKHRIQGDFS